MYELTKMLAFAGAVTVAGATLASCDQQRSPRIESVSEAVKVGEHVKVELTEPAPNAATNQYWLSLSPVGAPDSDRTGKVFVAKGMTTKSLQTTEPGKYEVRLHGGFPKQPHNVVDRRSVTVK